MPSGSTADLKGAHAVTDTQPLAPRQERRGIAKSLRCTRRAVGRSPYFSRMYPQTGRTTIEQAVTAVEYLETLAIDSG